MTPHDHPRLVALLRAILAAPSCDAARLVYADALDELGDGDKAAQERAEFIRLQVELANIMAAPSSARNVTLKWCGGAAECRWRPTCLVHELRRREAELLDLAAEVKWRGPANHANGFIWRRGFIEMLRLKANTWLEHADAITAAQPVTAVTLTTWPDPGRLTTLTLSRGRGPGVADTEETSATRWCLRQLWPGVTFTLPSPSVHGTLA